MAMIIAIPKERRADEARVAATPETAKKLKGLGLDVVVDRGAGAGAQRCLPRRDRGLAAW